MKGRRRISGKPKRSTSETTPLIVSSAEREVLKRMDMETVILEKKKRRMKLVERGKKGKRGKY